MNGLRFLFTTLLGRWLLILLLMVSCHTSAMGTFFQGGRSSYHIVLPSTASTMECHAATELQQYINKVSGATLPIILADSRQAGHNVYVGYFPSLKNVEGTIRPLTTDERYTCVAQGGDLYIWGGSQAGTMYGVYAFLEKRLGIRWLAPDCTVIPSRDRFALQDFKAVGSPAFSYRHVFYYSAQRNLDWSAHNLLNGYSGATVSPDYGSFGGWWGIHTMGTLIPAKDYFASHPEYFCLRDGKRQADGQLCLSNKQVVGLLTKKIETVIAANPTFKVFSVSQNDNEAYCQCKACQALERKYGGHSGLLLWVVNQVASQISEKYPQVYISTLAYQYTQAPPTGIKPADNVFIQLTDVNNCFVHSFTQADNRAFLHDLEGWTQLTDKVYLWDYVTNFFHYLLPFPFVHAMTDNYRALAARKVYGVMAEGQYQTTGAGFDELNCWLLAKQMWNPYQDVDSLANIFIQGYYGKASAPVSRYYQLCNSLVNDQTHLWFVADGSNSLYTSSFVDKARQLMREAVKAASADPTVLRRVERLQAQVLYLEVSKDKARAVASGDYTTLLRILKEQQMNLSENQTAAQYLRQAGYI